MTRTHNNT